MMNSRVTVTLLLLATAAFMAFAQPPGGQRRANRMNAKPQLAEALNLTDQQKTQVEKMHLDLERKQAQLHSRIQVARLDMKEAYLADKIDRSAIEKSVKQVSDLQSQLKMNFVDFWFSVDGILTPDQQKAWKQHAMGMMDGMRGRLRDRMHMGGRGMTPGPPGAEEKDN